MRSLGGPGTHSVTAGGHPPPPSFPPSFSTRKGRPRTPTDGPCPVPRGLARCQVTRDPASRALPSLPTPAGFGERPGFAGQPGIPGGRRQARRTQERLAWPRRPSQLRFPRPGSLGGPGPILRNSSRGGHQVSQFQRRIRGTRSLALSPDSVHIETGRPLASARALLRIFTPLRCVGKGAHTAERCHLPKCRATCSPWRTPCLPAAAASTWRRWLHGEDARPCSQRDATRQGTSGRGVTWGSPLHHGPSARGPE